MTRRHVLAGLLFSALLPSAALAAPAPNGSHEIAGSHGLEIQSLELQYLATKDPDQRKQAIHELKALMKSSPGADAGALNAAVSAMLPAADSEAEAEALLAIAAAHPAGYAAGAAQGDAADGEFLVDARRAAQGGEAATGDVEELADIRIDRLGKDGQGRDGLTSAHVQQVWRINSEQGARNFSSHPVMYAAMSETLGIVRARVLRRDGGEVAAAVSADQPVEERGSAMYFDSRSRDLRFGQLQAGDLVEIEYHLLPAAAVNPWAGYYARIDLFRDSLPTRLRRRVLIAPSAMKLYAVEHGVGAASGAAGRRGDDPDLGDARHCGASRWKRFRRGPAPADRICMFPRSARSRSLAAGTAGCWSRRLKLDENLQAVARQILERNLSPQGKVQAVYESVQRRTKYVAFEFGVHSYQPYPLVATVARRGFGDCKDKAAMIVALLRAVGVPAEFAMMRTRSAGDVDPEAYSVQLFNHAVAYVPELNLYLDGTAEYAALGELPPDDQGALAMTVDAEGKATRRTVPFASPEANRVTREVRAQLDRNGRWSSPRRPSLQDTLRPSSGGAANRAIWPEAIGRRWHSSIPR